MAKSNANRLESGERLLVKQWIVAGLTNGQIRAGLAQRGLPADLTDSTFTAYRQAPQVQADIEAAMKLARVEGMANRIQRVKRLQKRLTQIDFGIDGTTPSKDNPEIADPEIAPGEQDRQQFRVLVETELKLMVEMGRLVDELAKSSATITQKDTAGNVTGSTVVVADTTDAALRRISALAQSNDALEAVLRILEAETAQDAPLQSEKA